MLKNKVLILLILLILHFTARATHNRAGEITFRQISEFTYEVKIVTYTNTKPDELGRLPADRPSLEINWGDNTSSKIDRTKMINLANYYRYNEYVSTHTYPGPGVYTIFVQDPNRNQGVKNIPNPLQTVFAIDTKLVINADLGFNNTPELLTPPVDRAAVGKLFIHNPAAYDIDGDSLSYSYTPCRGEDGLPIPGYKLPPASNKIYIDSINGDLIWDCPTETGLYNVAMNVTEWRNGVKISNIIRDMQIEVVDIPNNPPEINPPKDICVEAGDTATAVFSITDKDNDYIVDTLIGGVFNLSPNKAYYTQLYSAKGFVKDSFAWVTRCENIRKEPYKIIIKASDFGYSPSFISLVDIDHFDINVIGPSVDNLNAFPYNNAILLQWDEYLCPNIKGFNIYRKNKSTGLIPEKCETGVPKHFGFKKIGSVANNKTYFLDNNNGLGLEQGYEYCYRVVAVFNDNTESKSSIEICSYLVPPVPIITNVSVIKHDEKNGKIFIAWLKPKHLDTLKTKPLGPYLYKIYRSDDLFGTNFQLIDSFRVFNLNDDTTYIDSINLNTIKYPYSYKIELYNDSTDKKFLIGNPGLASTIYSEIKSSDNTLELEFIKNTPWVNYSYDIYRSDNPLDSFKYVTTINDNNKYTDKNLVNGKKYCYKIISHGKILNHDKQFIENQNISHINCGIPIDNTPPCPPSLSVIQNCDSLNNNLIWSYSNNSCNDDVIGYKIYFSERYNSKYSVIKEIQNKETLNFIHKTGRNPVGCYYVTAIDSFLNESVPSDTVCNDVCMNYKLPNVFSPNADDINEIYHATGVDETISKVNMQIFNRWGQKIFQTTNPYINWRGEIEGTNKIVPSGIYYYICDVYINGVTGEIPVNLVGFIYVFTDKKILNKPE